MNNYYQNIEEIKKILDEVPLEMNEGTKLVKEKYKKNMIELKNNKLNELIEQYNKDLELVSNKLKERVEQLEPLSKSNEIELNQNKLNLLRKVIYYNNEFNDYYDKLGFEQLILSMDDSDNCDLIETNNLIIKIINKFEKAGIKLTSDDFNYTFNTYQYMKVFFEKLNDEKFDDYMNDTFEKIYWNCPKLLTTIKLNIRYLIKNNEKKLNEYALLRQKDLFEQSSTDEYNYEDAYMKLHLVLDDRKNKDAYLNINEFKNTRNIDEYIISSIKRNEIFNKYSKNDFNSMDKENQNKFYDSIRDLGNSIIELKNYKLFSLIINDVKEKYKDKDKIKNVYNSNLKKIKKLENERNKLVKKYLTIYNKNSYSKKLVNLNNNIMNKVVELNDMYKELDKSRIIEKICTNINENSTIYDALLLAGSFYGYLKTTIIRDYEISDIKDVERIINDYYAFIYSPNTIIVKKVNLFSETDLEHMILQKCKIIGININEINDNNLINDIDFINKINDIENSNIKLEEIKFIIDVKKLNI